MSIGKWIFHLILSICQRSLLAMILCSRVRTDGVWPELPLRTEGMIAMTLTIASQKYAVLRPLMKRSLSEDVIAIGFKVDITNVIVW